MSNENQDDLVEAVESDEKGWFRPVEDEASEVEVPTPLEVHHFDAAETPPRPAVPNRAPHKSQTQVAGEVWAGKWGEDGWQDRVEAAGFDVETIETLVSKGVGRRSENDAVPALRLQKNDNQL